MICCMTHLFDLAPQGGQIMIVPQQLGELVKSASEPSEGMSRVQDFQCMPEILGLLAPFVQVFRAGISDGDAKSFQAGGIQAFESNPRGPPPLVLERPFIDAIAGVL